MKLGSIAALAVVALALVPAAGMAATTPKKPAPAVAPTAPQFDQGVAAYGRADYATAYRLWRPLAERGNATAQAGLGYMYENGRGVAQDYAAASSWYRKAADQGYAEAQLNLGLMYANGQGVAQDYVQAHKWSNLSAASGNADALKNRDMIAAKMTPAQIGEAQRLASAWRKK